MHKIQMNISYDEKEALSRMKMSTLESAIKCCIRTVAALHFSQMRKIERRKMMDKRGVKPRNRAYYCFYLDEQTVDMLLSIDTDLTAAVRECAHKRVAQINREREQLERSAIEISGGPIKFYLPPID